MFINIKALIVVMVLALITFRLTRPVCLQFMSEAAFTRRRNAWLALTTIAFLSPAFWIFAICEVAVIVWLNRDEENPLNVFMLLLFIIPNIRYYIPAPLVNQFFDLSQYRILSLAILLPVAIRIFKRSGNWASSRLGFVDVLMLAYISTQLVIPMPYESVTNSMRRAFLLFIDTTLVVYVFQRIGTRKQLAEVLACFWLASMMMAPVAVFESVKSWLLYTGINDLWGDPNVFSYLFRGGSLRAQATAGHSIALGYILSAALGVFLFLWRPTLPRHVGFLIVGVLLAALIATGSRGALVTAFIIGAMFVALRPNAGRRLGAAVLGSALILGAMYLSPLKESVLDRLPVIGTADQDTILYRQQLFDVSWQLIKQNPFFGDPFVVNKLESLRQGQGIIDIVNGYIYISLFYGIVTLLFLLGSFSISLFQTLMKIVSNRGTDEPAATMGVALFSTLAATMFFIGTAGINTIHIIIMGLLLSYAKSVVPVKLKVPSASARGRDFSVHLNRIADKT